MMNIFIPMESILKYIVNFKFISSNKLSNGSAFWTFKLK